MSHPLCFPHSSTITLTAASAHYIGFALFTDHGTRSTGYAPLTPLDATLTKNMGVGAHHSALLSPSHEGSLGA
jgi:hypothetical protein